VQTCPKSGQVGSSSQSVANAVRSSIWFFIAELVCQFELVLSIEKSINLPVLGEFWRRCARGWVNPFPDARGGGLVEAGRPTNLSRHHAADVLHHVFGAGPTVDDVFEPDKDVSRGRVVRISAARVEASLHYASLVANPHGARIYER